MTAAAETPIVIKLSGKALAAESELEALFRELESEGRAFVLVHGGGIAVDSLMKALSLEVKRIRGLRVSPAEDMPLIAGALAGTCSLELRAAAVRAGLRPLGMIATDGGICRLLPQDPELGRVAKTAAGEAASRTRLLELLSDGWIPVISSIGLDGEGNLWNINADDAAESVAVLLGSPLIFLSDVRGVLDGEKRLIASLDADRAETLIAENVIREGMAVKVRAALAASRTTHAPVAIASIFDETLAPTIASGRCPGTMLTA